jgi:signal transduction histidine kinase
MNNAFLLILNGIMLALGMSLLLLSLLVNIRREIQQFFALFWLLLLLWHAGAMVVQVSTLVGLPESLVQAAASTMEIGFTAASIGLYALTTALTQVLSRRLRYLMLVSMAVLLGLRALLLSTNAPASLFVGGAGETPPFGYTLFYLLFNGAALLLVWQARQRIGSTLLTGSLAAFAIGQGIALLNPALGTYTVSLVITSAAALAMSVAVLRREIVRPMAERGSQIEAVRTLGISITSRDPLDHVLPKVVERAAALSRADSAALFLQEDGRLALSASVSLPDAFASLAMNNTGVAAECLKTGQPIRIERYNREWKGSADLPYAFETFGSVIALPLSYDGHSFGALMVISGRDGRVFSADDVYLLQLLALQASVAIANNRMLSEQQALTRQVELARSQLETVLVSTESPVVALDRDFRLLFANPAAAALFEPAEGARTRIFDYFSGGTAILPPHGLAALREIRRTRAYTYELYLKKRVYLCHVAPLGAHRITGWVAVLNDITQLKELDRMKSEMVRMTSHDLKNPLQAAMAHIDLLRDDLSSDTTSADVTDSIETIDRQLMRMNRIISGILDLERYQSGRVQFERIMPAALVARVSADAEDTSQARGVAFEAHIEADVPAFAGDTEQMTRAVANLLENAFKFTPGGGRVSLRVSLRDDEIVFAVYDTGVGIPAHQHHSIFERFFRANQPGVEHVSGTGLGLSLVKAIAENHRGRVWFESAEGQGSAFFLAVPVNAETNRRAVVRV